MTTLGLEKHKNRSDVLAVLGEGCWEQLMGFPYSFLLADVFSCPMRTLLLDE
jgi:hypothetical protein